jgi:predicted RNA binding protein YcfA (HicA-like mRNA interferase family)
VPKTPIVSFRDVLRALGKLGYEVSRKRGSHMRLACVRRSPVTLPAHNPVAPGTLRSVLRTADITIDQFIKLLEE